MIIKRVAIKNFGKIHNKSMEFSPGINVLYGENESGKTTTHVFVKSMLYGIQRQRGRAARKDAYTIYLPWENPAVYGGILWFENGGKNFRLSRNFYKENQECRLLCEDDGEVLESGQDDLEAVLGGVSETVYENTVSIAQLKSTTGVELVREVQNYMASYQKAGDSSVDLGRTMQILKMTRKGFQVQADRRKKENQQEKEKIASNIEYLQKEIEELMDQDSQIESQETALYTGEEENGGRILDERIHNLQSRKNTWNMIGILCCAAGVAGAAVTGLLLHRLSFFCLIPLAIGLAALLAVTGLKRRTEEELEKRKRQKSRWSAKQEKLQWNREKLEETKKEKNTALSNLISEYQEAEEHVYHPLAEELEIESLNLAMKTIEKLSRDIHRQVGGRLRRRTSQILSEITGGKYADVLMDADLRMTVNTEGRTVSLDHLSRGTVEQVYFALRMAAGELLCGEEKFPVILDEVFGMYDEERLAAVLSWLAGEKRQVIICSCRQREMEIMEKMGIPFHKVTL